MSERVQKVLANAGLASRRQLEEWIKSGRVKINGKLAVLGDSVENGDKVYLDGRRVNFNIADNKTRRVLVYHKKEGEVCTRSDPEGRPTIFANLPPIKADRWVTVGRLDINTSGLLLCTNDGDLAHKLMHPSYEVPREYAVRVRGEVTPEIMKMLKKGVLLDDGIAKFNDITFSGGENQNRWYHVVLLEGRNREVRRLFESQGLTVNRLKRVRFGTIVLTQKVRQGKFVELTEKDIQSLDEMLSYLDNPEANAQSAKSDSKLVDKNSKDKRKNKSTNKSTERSQETPSLRAKNKTREKSRQRSNKNSPESDRPQRSATTKDRMPVNARKSRSENAQRKTTHKKTERGPKRGLVVKSNNLKNKTNNKR